MSEKIAKAEINIGALSFKGEGDQEWLADQIAKLVEAATLSGVANQPQGSGKPKGGASQSSGEFKTSLAGYLKEKGAQKKQVERFLATARWLQLRGNADLTASAVAKALSDHHQPRLANPADCLNQNAGKGYCEKAGKSFFITPDGLKFLGRKLINAFIGFSNRSGHDSSSLRGERTSWAYDATS